MDEIEQRLAALELLAIELLADLPVEARGKAAARIREGLEHALDGDEATIRRQALQHLEDAAGRHRMFGWREGRGQ
jgi:hypothetical protein